MSRRGLVIPALLLGLAGFGLRLLLVFWWQPLMWRLDGMNLFVGFALGLVVAIGVPVVAWLVVLWLHWRKIRPGIVEMRAGRFVVPNGAAFGGSQFVLFMVNAGGLVPTERVPGHDAMRIYADPVLLIVSIGTLAVFVLVAVTFLFWPKPRIELTPAGIEFHYFLSRRNFTWEELAPGGPPTPGRFQKLSVLVRGPRGGWMPTTVPAIMLAERGFIASLIRYYADHPAYRAGIGTAAEHARLVGADGPLRSPSGDPAHQPGYAPAIVDGSS